MQGRCILPCRKACWLGKATVQTLPGIEWPSISSMGHHEDVSCVLNVGRRGACGCITTPDHMHNNPQSIGMLVGDPWASLGLQTCIYLAAVAMVCGMHQSCKVMEGERPLPPWKGISCSRVPYDWYRCLPPHQRYPYILMEAFIYQVKGA